MKTYVAYLILRPMRPNTSALEDFIAAINDAAPVAKFWTTTI